jgi:hypothetical protein
VRHFLTLFEKWPSLSPSPLEVIVRFLLLGVLFFGLAESAVAQCPVLPRHASVDPTGRNVAIRYYNSGSSPVQAVEFILTRPQAGQNEPTVIARYAARQTLHPKIEKTAVFQRPPGESDFNEAAEVEALEVQVTRVVFLDQSTWRSGRENVCKVSFSPR